jgi:tRNA (cmo5U34)-methyltransferase
MTKVGDSISAGNANWSFGGQVAATFDDHVSKSVPLYHQGHDLVVKLSDFFLSKGSLAYDFGCSTGTLLALLAERNRGKQVRLVGIEPEQGMVEQARIRAAPFDSITIEQADLFDVALEKADLVTSYYTIQFVRPRRRQELFDKVFEALNWGGGFVFFEKVRAPDARFQDMMSLIYTDYKLDVGYDADEIVGKSRSLKGVLEPFSGQANIDLAKRAGFQDVMTIFKYVCFEGFLAIK